MGYLFGKSIFKWVKMTRLTVIVLLSATKPALPVQAGILRGVKVSALGDYLLRTLRQGVVR